MALKVCLCIPSFDPGGAERQIVNLARELASRGIQVILLHSKKDIQYSFYLEVLRQADVKIISSMSPDFLKAGTHLSKQCAEFFSRIPIPLLSRMALLFLAGALAHIRPDVLHTYLDGSNCMGGCAAAMAGVPVHLASFRNVDPSIDCPEKADMLFSLYRYLLEHGHTSFEANSRAGAEHYARWLSIDAESIFYNPNGLDPAAYLKGENASANDLRQSLNIPANSPLILTLARYAPQKAPETMLDVFTRVLESRPHCRYLVAGSGMTADQEMGEHVRARGLEDRVHLLGVQSNVAALLKAADVFLLPSRFEGFPNVLMEAMAMGLPVVASNVGGCPDLVRHGQDGFLHEWEDQGGMAQSVLALLADAELSQRLGKSGRQRVLEEFSLQKLGDRTLKRYEDLLAKTGYYIS